MDATTVRSSDAHLAPGVATSTTGYGYQVWLLPGADRRFVLLGIRGPDDLCRSRDQTGYGTYGLCVRSLSIWRLSAETVALWIAVVDQLGRHAQ